MALSAATPWPSTRVLLAAPPDARAVPATAAPPARPAESGPAAAPSSPDAPADTGGGGWLGQGGFLARDDCEQPVLIESHRLTIDNKAGLMTYEGDVKVTRCDVTILSQVLDVHYGEKHEIRSICAKGGVNVTQGERAAKGEQGCYDEGQETIVLTGHPQVWQGGDVVSGETIRVFLNEERSIVEGSAGERVKTTFFPKGRAVTPQAPGRSDRAEKGTTPSAEKSEKNGPDGASRADPAREPIRISSLWLQLDRASSTALYRGSVEAHQKDLRMTSAELTASFDPRTRLLTDALATGGVTVKQGERVATGDEAHYRAEPGEIVLKGSPVLREGHRIVRGNLIRYDMDNDQVAIVGGEDGGRPRLEIPASSSGESPDLGPLTRHGR